MDKKVVAKPIVMLTKIATGSVTIAPARHLAGMEKGNAVAVLWMLIMMAVATIALVQMLHVRIVEQNAIEKDRAKEGKFLVLISGLAFRQKGKPQFLM